MRRSAAALLACSTATALTATALTALKEPSHREGAAASEERAWLRSRQLRPEDESISKKKANSQGVAGGPCYPSKTECPFSTSCEWDRDTEDGEEFRERICVHKDLVPANGHDWATIVLLICATAFSSGRRHRGRRAAGAHLPARRRLPHHASDSIIIGNNIGGLHREPLYVHETVPPERIIEKTAHRLRGVFIVLSCLTSRYDVRLRF